MESTIGFAIIGCGAIGKRHAEQINKIKDAKLIAVVDNNLEKAKQLGLSYNADWYINIHEVLLRKDIDVVNICTPSGMHRDFAIKAAKAKKHIIVEKPIEVTLEKADEIIVACKKNGVKLSVISQHRFDNSTKVLKNIIMEGKLGNLFLCNTAVNWYRSQKYYDSSGWRGTIDLDGGGALMNQSIHMIDLMQYLMGPVESVKADIGTFNHTNIQVEDVATALIKFKNGGLGTVVGTTAAYPGYSTRIEIFGTKGSAIIDSNELTHLYFMDKQVDDKTDKVNNLRNLVNEYQLLTSNRKVIEFIHPHKDQIEDMIDAIRNYREPLVDGQEGRTALEIILGIYKSAKNCKTIYFPL